MKYIIYCRKSTDTEDKQVLSLESQQKELERVAEAHNLHVVARLNESKSAKEPGRPVFNEMLQMIVSGKADAILCWKVDRLTRNPLDGGQIQWLLQSNKIKCITTFEKNYYPNDNVLLMSIEQAMANQYIRDLSVNVKRGNRAKLERGEWPNHAPFGYLNDKATKRVVIDTERSPYVIRAYELYTTGSYSFKNISDILYTEGLRTMSGKKVLKSQIHRILVSKFYTGLMERDGKIYPGTHPVLIPTQTFDMAQNIMTGRVRTRPHRLFFPLRGLLKCEDCGCSMTASVKKSHHYYYCTNGKGTCDAHKSYLREQYLYSVIAAQLSLVDFTERKIEIMYRAAKERSDHGASYLAQTLNTHELHLESLKPRESRLLDTFLAEQVSKELYDQKWLELQNERIVLTKKISELKTQQPSLTLEPVKSVFLQASRAKKEFLEGDDMKKKKIIDSLLWNLTIKNKDVAQVSFKSPFDIMAKVPKDASISEMLRVRDSNP